MTRLAAFVLAICVIATAGEALAQPSDRRQGAPRRGELTVFSDANFRGRSFYVTSPSANLNVPFQVRSFMMAPGEVWQLCTRPNFAPDCGRFDRDEPDRGASTGIAIRSARFLGPGVGGGGDEFSGTGYAGPSLRGMASEFFQAPEHRGARVLACRFGPSANCAADTATRFCRARGFSGSAFQRTETVRGQMFLADVLCTR